MNINDISIFGHYTNEENRATSALLKILSVGGTQFISDVVKDLIKNWKPYEGIQITTQFATQPKASVYDGLLQSNFSFDLIIESKIYPNSICKGSQLDNLKKKSKKLNTYVLYITPDVKSPILLKGTEISWCTWEDVISSLQKHNTQKEPLNYLIEQFSLYLIDLDLTNAKNRVVIAAGGRGRDIALKYEFYTCQNNRTMKSCKYLAF